MGNVPKFKELIASNVSAMLDDIQNIIFESELTKEEALELSKKYAGSESNYERLIGEVLEKIANETVNDFMYSLKNMAKFTPIASDSNAENLFSGDKIIDETTGGTGTIVREGYSIDSLLIKWDNSGEETEVSAKKLVKYNPEFINKSNDKSKDRTFWIKK